MRRNFIKVSSTFILLKKRASAVLVKPQDINQPPASTGVVLPWDPRLKALEEHPEWLFSQSEQPHTLCSFKISGELYWGKAYIVYVLFQVYISLFY